jgi:hypothetical protein
MTEREVIGEVAEFSDDAFRGAVSEKELQLFFDSPVWKLIKMGIVRTMNQAYIVMEHANATPDMWRRAQGVVEACRPWLYHEEAIKAGLVAYHKRLTDKGQNPAEPTDRERQRASIGELFDALADAAKQRGA